MDETKLHDQTNQEPVPGAATSGTAAVAPDDALAHTGDGGPEAVEDNVAENVTDPAAAGLAAQVAELESALADERERAGKLLDQSQRMAADFQNSRRRLESQVQEEIERASTHLVRRLLPVIDDFELAFAHTPADVDAGAAWVEGFRQIQRKLNNLLGEEGLQVIAVEGEFDPTLHEAVSGEASDDVPSGHIIGTLRTGYTYKGKVLRPALVRVAM